MKKNMFLLSFFTIIIIGFYACKEDMEKYHFSPSIGITAALLPDSVLTVYATQYENLSILDTIHSGDTVRLVLRLNGYGFNLTDFSIEKGNQLSSVYILNADSLKQIVTENSDFDNNQYQFLKGIAGVTLPLNYIPRGISGNDSISLYVSSDITSKENVVKQILRIPVKPERREEPD